MKEHHATVGPSPYMPLTHFQASCGCGWSGGIHQDGSVASQQAREHNEETGGGYGPWKSTVEMAARKAERERLRAIVRAVRNGEGISISSYTNDPKGWWAACDEILRRLEESA